MTALAYVANSNDPDLLTLAGQDQAKVDRAIRSGAFQIDTAFEQAGYSVPIDPELVSNEERQANLTAFLDDLNTSLAAGILTRGSAGKKGTPDNVRLNFERAQEWLEKIAAGAVGFAELTTSSSAAFRAVGNTRWKPGIADDDETSFDDLFDTEAVLGGGI